MEALDIYKCDICGNVIEVLSAGSGELVCCGEAMKKQEAKTAEEAALEKHVPVFIKYNTNECEIRVGEVLHPMSNEHYIMFIQTISPDKKNVQLKFLSPADVPKMIIKNLESGSLAREFCNIHGLWEGKSD